MPILPVLTYPHSLLKEKMPELAHREPLGTAALSDLVETMQYHEGCVGLAAPQIGHKARALVVDVSRSPRPCENHGLLKLINPQMVEASQWKISREGCLSFPDLLANVKRAQKICLRAFDVDWKPVELTCVGFEAVALQHEIDHLDGILFLDRIRSSKDLFERRKPAPASL